jgi:cytochrome b561
MHMSAAPQSYRTYYDGVQKSLHWIVALCVLTIIPVGITMGRVQGDIQNTLFNFHKSLGVLILTLMTLRLIYRLTKGVPKDTEIPAFFRVAGSATHWILYILLFVTPIMGYVANSAYGAPTPFFGLFELPPIVAKNEALSETLFARHKFLGFTTAVFVAMHIGAGLFHYIIRRDGVLQRMLPGR